MQQERFDSSLVQIQGPTLFLHLELNVESNVVIMFPFLLNPCIINIELTRPHYFNLSLSLSLFRNPGKCRQRFDASLLCRDSVELRCMCVCWLRIRVRERES